MLDRKSAPRPFSVVRSLRDSRWEKEIFWACSWAQWPVSVWPIVDLQDIALAMPLLASTPRNAAATWAITRAPVLIDCSPVDNHGISASPATPTTGPPDH